MNPAHSDSHPHTAAAPIHAASVLGWPAWLRLLAVLPLLALLWLGLAWAGGWPW